MWQVVSGIGVLQVIAIGAQPIDAPIAHRNSRLQPESAERPMASIEARKPHWQASFVAGLRKARTGIESAVVERA
jgi:hypothetical protein